MTVMPLSATVLQKINVAMDHLCQIALNQNCAKEICKKRPACTGHKINFRPRSIVVAWVLLDDVFMYVYHSL